MKIRHIFFLVLLCGASLTSLAQGFEPVLSEPLQQRHEQLDVRGRQGLLIRQKLVFGPYRSLQVRRSGIRSTEGFSGMPGLFWVSHMEGRQSIRFSLTNGSDTSRVLAVSRVAAEDFIIGHGRPPALQASVNLLHNLHGGGHNNYSVAIYQHQQDTVPWELYLDHTAVQLRRRDYTGFLSRGDVYYTIVPLWQVRRKGRVRELPAGIAGFEIRNAAAEPLAAVELMSGNGMVYLAPVPEDERFLLANACAALLLHQHIQEP
jgi:hypothetical protein